jgi:hypothetical protein
VFAKEDSILVGKHLLVELQANQYPPPSTLNEILLNPKLNSFLMIQQIQEAKQFFETSDHLEQSVLFREFRPQFAREINGMKYIALNLNKAFYERKMQAAKQAE